MWMSIAFTTGLIGSLHCVGMCGPLFMALHGGSSSGSKGGYGPLFYHGGRIAMYMILGITLGLLGQGVSIWGWQRVLTISMGVAIILLQFSPRFLNLQAFKANNVFKRAFNLHQRNASYGTTWLMGMANGLLPCGLVYIALATALVQPDLLGSMWFMLLFGLGTLPAWGMCTWGMRLLPASKVKPLLAGFSIVVGVFLILRGMEMGIPFVSPHNPTTLYTGIPICK